MTETRYREAAGQVLAEYKASLLELQPHYEEAVFTGLVAFLGIQNGLWPLWIQLCDKLGHPMSETEQLQKLSDPDIHLLPWFCATNPFTPEAAWMLVRGSGLPDSASVYPELMRSDICSTLLTISQQEPTIFYGQAADVFGRWGLYTDRQKLDVFGTVRDFDELPSEGRSELHVPAVHCERLLADWSLWRNALLSVVDELRFFLEECVASRGTSAPKPSLRLDFLRLASALWDLLLEAEIIHCAPFDAGKVPFWDIFRAKKTLKFHGFMVLFGDHYQLWKEFSKQRYIV